MRYFLLPLFALLASTLGGAAAAQDSSDRFERALRGWDANQDGVLSQDEAPEAAWRVILQRAERAGMELGDSVKIAALLEARRSRRGDNAEQDSDERAEPRRLSDDKGQTAGFASTSEPAKVRGFGDVDEPQRETSPRRSDSDSANSEFRQRAERYSRGIFRRYDDNKDGVLDSREWRNIRTGEPKQADANGDGKITPGEYADFLEAGFLRQQKGESSSSSPRERERSKPRRSIGKSQDEGDQQASYRFTPAHERLPEGLPRWFRQRDQNADGQVSMHEYSRTWTDSRAAEFARYDKNGDGVLTPAELVKK